MNEETSIVVQRIQLLYSPNESDRVESEKWLQQLSTQASAWTIYLELLQNPDITLSHFGANSLVQKITLSWDNLSNEKQEEMIQILISAFDHFAVSGPQLVLTRIIVALSQIIKLTFPQKYHNLVRFIELPQTYSTRSGREISQEYILAIIKLFEIIPQEMGMNTDIRNQLFSSYENIIINIILFLQQALDSDSILLKLNAIKCCSSWSFSWNYLIKTELIQKIFMNVFKYVIILMCLGCY
jgi:hypothetical protein